MEITLILNDNGIYYSVTDDVQMEQLILDIQILLDTK